MKKLYWEKCKESQAIKYAKLHGLDMAYYITPNENEYELSLIDGNGSWDDKVYKLCNSITQAEKIANSHYENLVNKLAGD